MPERRDDLFDADDLDVIERVFDLFPDAAITAHAVKLARKRLTFPIVDHEGFRVLFDNRGRARFRSHLITFDQAKEFFPPEFFPIESERDFIVRVLIALQRARVIHAREARDGKSTEAAADESVSILPSAVPLT